MKTLISAVLALTLLVAAPARAQEPDPPSQVPVMMDLVRMIMQQAREGRLDQLMPRQDQLRGLEGVLRPDQDGYALADELLQAVRLSPEQEEQMRSFRFSREQLFAMLDYVMDHGLETRPQDLDPFLTREQQQVVDGLQLTSQQIDTFRQLLSDRLLPLMDSLQGRVGDLGNGVELNGSQGDLLQMLLQMIPPSTKQ